MHKVTIGGKKKSKKKKMTKENGKRGYISVRFGWLKGSGSTKKGTRKSKTKRKTRRRKSRR
jgi:hypothetical protein